MNNCTYRGNLCWILWYTPTTVVAHPNFTENYCSVHASYPLTGDDRRNCKKNSSCEDRSSEGQVFNEYLFYFCSPFEQFPLKKSYVLRLRESTHSWVQTQKQMRANFLKIVLLELAVFTRILRDNLSMRNIPLRDVKTLSILIEFQRNWRTVV